MPSIDWGVAGRALPGEPESADRSLVLPTADGALVAVADGLGHGDEAAAAADKAIETLRSAPADEPLAGLLARCHAALTGTRGCVLSLARIARGTLSWLGVGDVEVVLHRRSGRPRESLLLRAGVVGDRIPRSQAAELAIEPGDTLVLATDGIKRAFADVPSLVEPPQSLAEMILAAHARPTDDALVLVVRYRGTPHHTGEAPPGRAHG